MHNHHLKIEMMMGFSLRRRRRGKRIMMTRVVIMMRLVLHHLFPSDTAHDPTEPTEVQSEFRRLLSHSILERIPVVTEGFR